MKRWWSFVGLLFLFVGQCVAQQVLYATLKDLVAGRGDTLTTLKVEKRSKNQICLLGGADYRITVENNSGLSRYLRSRCYAVKVDTALYVNCKKMKYKHFRFGKWYAPAIWVAGKIYFCAQPIGSVAGSCVTPTDAAKLGGEVGTAIASSGLVNIRVFYELNLVTGKAEFVGKEKMLSLLNDFPDLQDAFLKESSEMADVVGKYLMQIKKRRK